MLKPVFSKHFNFLLLQFSLFSPNLACFQPFFPFPFNFCNFLFSCSPGFPFFDLYFSFNFFHSATFFFPFIAPFFFSIRLSLPLHCCSPLIPHPHLSVFNSYLSLFYLFSPIWFPLWPSKIVICIDLTSPPLLLSLQFSRLHFYFIINISSLFQFPRSFPSFFSSYFWGEGVLTVLFPSFLSYFLVSH